ncbi:transposase [Paraburkholderia kururiensis]|uniref:Transposase n=1 Tax=Paraburkholderia kururiensis TaxID=984307 RepID=A0ABZ0WRV8_9BURK|nr:transposase [Paraburkholderia kururiensis]WQD80107.1 transposase [Paraburkholderia kururiensis]
MFFDELSNEEWAQVAALVSDEPVVRLNRRGRPRAEPRVVANAVLWILTTGEPWSKLPGRYPSGPTCRRRFEEWQLNGTLAEVVRILSQGGRKFAYVPEPSAPVARQTAPDSTPPAREETVRADGMRGVFWKSPESWQTPDATPGWRAFGRSLDSLGRLDPIANITRQLAGEPEGDADDAHASRATTAAGQGATHSSRSSQSLHTSQGQQVVTRDPMWSSLPAQGEQVVDRRGYVIYAMAQPIPNRLYRAAAEIMRDGRRVERSGLVGPRFDDAEVAQRYALEWAQQWIDRDCRTRAAAQQLAQQRECGAVSAPVPSRPPLANQVQRALPGAPNAGTVTRNAADALNGNARWVALRRYPTDVVSRSEDVTLGALGDGDAQGASLAPPAPQRTADRMPERAPDHGPERAPRVSQFLTHAN